MNDPGPADPEFGPYDDGIDWLDPHGGAEPVVVATAECWRCGKMVATSLPLCPYCRARLGTGGGMVRARPDDGPSVDPARGVGRVLYLYLLFLATSVVYGMTIDFSLFRKAPPTDEQIRFHLNKMLVVEVIDTVLVLAGIAWAGRPAAPPAIGPRRKLLAWVGAPIILAVLLLVNFAYFRLIRSGLGAPDPNLDRVLKPELIPWLVFGMCLQPAVVEEFFFRYLAQGHLRPVVGTHGAVWIAAVMFGVSHLFNPLGVPYLIVAGAVFGYARVYGRSLAIPMLMHFAHNAIVIWSEPWL